MNDHFNRFAVRFFTTLLLCLLLLLLHGFGGKMAGIFTPQHAAPWELSKLIYWPMLVTLLLTAHLSGGAKKTILCAAPYLTLTPLALFFLFWLISSLHPAAGVYFMFLAVAGVIGIALCNQEKSVKKPAAWVILLAALGAAYILFSFLPPRCGPFLDPNDALAMAPIPY